MCAGGGWRYPALFALVWFTVSGINASGPVYAVVAPTLWLLYAVFVAKEHTLRQAWATVWRTVVLTAGVSLWWAYALAIESGYGLNVLGRHREGLGRGQDVVVLGGAARPRLLVLLRV